MRVESIHLDREPKKTKNRGFNKLFVYCNSIQNKDNNELGIFGDTPPIMTPETKRLLLYLRGPSAQVTGTNMLISHYATLTLVR